MLPEIQQRLPRALLAELIEYAGLFPPAQLTMQATVDNFARYLRLSKAWMLGRLVVPLARMQEFVEVWKSVDSPPGTPYHWRISCLLPATSVTSSSELHAALAHLQGLGLQAGGSSDSGAHNGMLVVVDSLELAPVEPDAIKLFAAALPSTMDGFVELPVHEVDRFIPVWHDFPRLAAKLRLGGVRSENFPSSVSVAGAVRQLVQEQIRFKATEAKTRL